MLEGGISEEAPALIRHPSDKHYLRADQWSQAAGWDTQQQATNWEDF